MYKGFPLYLRRPVGLDFDALSKKFDLRLVLTHKFSFRRFDGGPEPVYNRTLEDLDLAITAFFENGGEGQIVLIETFGGERNYYFYVQRTVDPTAVLETLRSRFPGHVLEIVSASNPEWKFIRRYTLDYLNEA